MTLLLIRLLRIHSVVHFAQLRRQIRAGFNLCNPKEGQFRNEKFINEQFL